MAKTIRYRYTRSEKRSIGILCLIILLVNLSSLIGNQLLESESTDLTASMPEPRLLELNSADSLQLLDLPGIGPAFSGRIIRYRNLLGGYFHKSQLLEVYGMDSIRYQGFEKLIQVDAGQLVRINLNTATFKELLRHPYIQYEMVRAFVRYRDRSGPLQKLEEVWSIPEWPDSLHGRLMPYLKLDE